MTKKKPIQINRKTGLLLLLLALLLVWFGKTVWTYFVPTRPVKAQEVTGITISLVHDGNMEESLDSEDVEYLAGLLGNLRLKRSMFKQDSRPSCGPGRWVLQVRSDIKQVKLTLDQRGSIALENKPYAILEGADQLQEVVAFCQRIYP